MPSQLPRLTLVLLALWTGIPSWGDSPPATGSVRGDRAEVLLLVPDAVTAPRGFADALTRALRGQGRAVRVVSPDRWQESAAEVRDPGDLLIVLPGASFPSGGRLRLEAFLKAGNHLLNLSTAAFASLSDPPILETLSPAYKTYPTRADGLQLPERKWTFAEEQPVSIPLPRPRGLVSGAVSPLRFIPLAQALGPDGQVRGAVAHLLVNTTTEYAGSVWGALGLSAAQIEGDARNSVGLVVDMAERMLDGLFLADAGPGHCAYLASEPVVCGADLLNQGAEAQTVQVSIAVSHDGRLTSEWSESVTLPARSGHRPTHVASPPLTLAPGEYKVDVRISRGGRTVDEIEAPLQVLDYATVSPDMIVRVRGGEFILADRPWHPLGINYWPHLSVGLEPKDFSRLWLSPENYDPDLVERDLVQAEQLGLNLLSIQYSDPAQARSLMDFMARAVRHRLKVNVYLPALEPLRPDFALARRMILDAHLPESPAFFAYDVCWEGHLGNFEARRPSDGRWQDWVMERYDSVEAAEEDWRFHPPRTAGVISGPTDRQLMEDGEWRVYVAAYRRFWDDELSRRYRRVRQAIKEFDPIHLVGARSGYGGNGTPMYADHMPFDLASGARYLDFISPEGYALSGGWNDFLKGGLTTAYARLVSGGKPVFWAEYGVPLRWQVEPSLYRPPEKSEDLEPQRAYFQHMLRFVRETGADGCSGWWWPGGYRVDERSDFGIVNPDGTLRPAARELQNAAPDYAAPWRRMVPDMSLELDRDRQVNGYAGVYTALADRYAEASLAGHVPEVRTAGTGTTSVDTPPMAVGNVPWNGHNPPKYLNAEFIRVELQVRDGWRSLENGEPVEVPAGKVRLRVSVANTAEARWLPPGPELHGGGVALQVLDQRAGRRSCPLPAAVPFLGEATFPEIDLEVAPERSTALELVMTAEGRTTFGERFQVRLKPTAPGGSEPMH
jgi:hypothetical protein